MKNIFAITLAFAMIIAFAFAFATPSKAKTVTVEDVLSVVESVEIDCGEYRCFGSIRKIYDSNNEAVCYVYRFAGNSVSAGDTVSISCIK